MIFETAIYALNAFRFRVGDATSFRPFPPLLRRCLGDLPPETVAKRPCVGRFSAIWLQFEHREGDVRSLAPKESDKCPRI